MINSANDGGYAKNVTIILICLVGGSVKRHPTQADHVMPGRNSKRKCEKISRCSPRSPKWADLSYFTLFFCKARLRNVQRFIKTSVQSLFCSLTFCQVAAVVVCSTQKCYPTVPSVTYIKHLTRVGSIVRIYILRRCPVILDNQFRLIRNYSKLSLIIALV